MTINLDKLCIAAFFISISLLICWIFYLLIYVWIKIGHF